MKTLTALALTLASSLALASTPSASTQQEINHLFAYLKNSGCSFNRNGTWYEAGKAADHLQQKYDYLLKKKLVDSSEDFIARAATESSMSSKPYSVRCGNAAAVASGPWFRAELERYRKRQP
ncbi:MAG: DUF5329 domain-containing protein [Pedobacter sp.]|nr:DUF5329 domain-containing protein [Pedobacter sp.]